MFCVVDTVTRKRHKEFYMTRPAAKGILTRLINAGLATPTMVVMTSEEYHAQVQMKRVKNLMSGKWIEIPEDTPAACDPSTETYWSI